MNAQGKIVKVNLQSGKTELIEPSPEFIAQRATDKAKPARQTSPSLEQRVKVLEGKLA